jgi:hypothetical protein
MDDYEWILENDLEHSGASAQSLIIALCRCPLLESVKLAGIYMQCACL